MYFYMFLSLCSSSILKHFRMKKSIFRFGTADLSPAAPFGMSGELQGTSINAFFDRNLVCFYLKISQ